MTRRAPSEVTLFSGFCIKRKEIERDIQGAPKALLATEGGQVKITPRQRVLHVHEASRSGPQVPCQSALVRSILPMAPLVPMLLPCRCDQGKDFRFQGSRAIGSYRYDASQTRWKTGTTRKKEHGRDDISIRAL